MLQRRRIRGANPSLPPRPQPPPLLRMLLRAFLAMPSSRQLRSLAAIAVWHRFSTLLRCTCMTKARQCCWPLSWPSAMRIESGPRKPPVINSSIKPGCSHSHYLRFRQLNPPETQFRCLNCRLRRSVLAAFSKLHGPPRKGARTEWTGRRETRRTALLSDRTSRRRGSQPCQRPLDKADVAALSFESTPNARRIVAGRPADARGCLPF